MLKDPFNLFLILGALLLVILVMVADKPTHSERHEEIMSRLAVLESEAANQGECAYDNESPVPSRSD